MKVLDLLCSKIKSKSIIHKGITLEDIINSGKLYSYIESMIGTWVDGTPVYRKVIPFGALPNNTSKSVAHNINNLNKVISLTAFANSSASSGGGIPIPHAVNQYPTTLYIDYTNVTIITTNDRTAYTDTYIIVEYTKTTD